MNRSRSAVAAGIAGVMLLAGASPALGTIHTGGAVTKTKDIVIAKSSTGGAKVSCPTGMKATAGGARWLDDGFSTGLALSAYRTLGASLPTDSARKWFVSAYNGDLAVDQATLRITVTCLPSSTIGSLSFNAERVSPAGATGAVKTSVGCGSGKRIVAGGAAWQLPGDPLDAALANGHWIAGSAPKVNGRGWFGAGTRNVADTAELRVVAYCASNAAVGTYTTRTKQMNPVGVPTPFIVVMAGGSHSCPLGSRVVTGGALWKDPFSGETIAEGTLGSSGPSGKRSWYAAGDASDNGVNRAMLLVLQCRPT